MSHYRRWRVAGGTYFFTLTLLDRRATLLIDRLENLRGAFHAVRRKLPFHIDAIVVLPDHLHTIWTLPPGDVDYSARWSRIKSAFSRAMPRGESRSRSREARSERGIWQRRFWEHVIRDEADYTRHVDYIHYNPVKHGYALRPIDWPYSSLHKFVRRGVLSADWGTAGPSVDLDLD